MTVRPSENCKPIAKDGGANQNDQWHMPALGKADWPWGARERL